MKRSQRIFAAERLLPALAGICLIAAGAAQAQDGGASPDTGYRVNESKSSVPADNGAGADSKPTTGTTKRLARIEYTSGNVTWRPDDNATWNKAKTNLPLREGAQIWVTNGGRAEIRFDDGSVLRLGSGAIVHLETLYSDTQGRYAQIKMSDGLATLRLREADSIYEINTPLVSIKASGPGRLRVGVADSVEIGVRSGSVTLEGKPGKTTLRGGDFVSLRDSDTDYRIHDLPKPDSWERWNDDRDRKLDGNAPAPSRPRPAYAPASSFWLSLSFPFGSSYRSHGEGRGVRRYRR